MNDFIDLLLTNMSETFYNKKLKSQKLLTVIHYIIFFKTK